MYDIKRKTFIVIEAKLDLKIFLLVFLKKIFIILHQTLFKSQTVIKSNLTILDLKISTFSQGFSWIEQLPIKLCTCLFCISQLSVSLEPNNQN